MMKHRKRGSLSLSINAIVILIIAIAVLGLILGFTKGMFSKLEKKVGVAIDSTSLTNPPNSYNRVTLSPNQLTIAPGQAEIVQLGVYNSFGNNRFCKVVPTQTDLNATIVAPLGCSKAAIPNGDVGAWALSVLAAEDADNTQSVATITVTCYDTVACGPGDDPKSLTASLPIIVRS